MLYGVGDEHLTLLTELREARPMCRLWVLCFYLVRRVVRVFSRNIEKSPNDPRHFPFGSAKISSKVHCGTTISKLPEYSDLFATAQHPETIA